MARQPGTWFRNKATAIALSLFAAAAASLSGCAYHGGSATDIDNPAVQKFAWFSFLDGNDIREASAALGPKAPSRYRLVYNGQYDNQLGVYEINAVPSGVGNLLARHHGG